MFASTAFFCFSNHILKSKTLDRSQSATEESLLTCVINYIIICATRSVCFSSNWKEINVFPKHSLESKASEQSIEARKKLFCRVVVRNYLYNNFAFK